MFSPEATVQSARGSLRNPRRRQRKDSDGLQHTRRKRSKLSEDTYHPTGDAHVNGNGSATMNGRIGHVDTDVDGSLVVVDMPVREKKGTLKRGLRENTAHYLTKNENYSVKKLPGCPSELASGSKPFRTFALPSASLALALTSTHAWLWDYTSLTGPAKVLNLPLSFAVKPSDPLPLGAIVRNGPTNDFGILAVAPSSGKITFWENVDSAEARSHFPQRHQGVDGSVKLYSGEHITGLVDVEHAGYILILSSGRLAQLTLRDSQGRPNIIINVLQAPPSSNGSFFSFKGLLGSGIRKSIAAVKARPSTSKGQMEIITAAKNGLFQLWDISWSGQHIFKAEINVHDEVLAAVQNGTASEARGQQDAHILDFAFMDTRNARGSVSLLVLVALSGHDSVEYSLLEVDLSESFGVVSRAIPIRNYQQTQLPREPTATLLLPYPAHTAFVQFPGAVAVVSLAEPEESPDVQLLSDSGRPPFPFQDTIYFRSDRHVEYSGSALEQYNKKEGHSSAIIIIQGYGILRISAPPPSADEGNIERHKVTAKSKLEQATFFSTVPDNILDFSIKSRYTFGQEEVESAALEISSRILSSSYEHVEKVTSSMDDQIRKRAFTLRTLIGHLRSDYTSLSFTTKWELLVHAEKLAVALALWHGYQERVDDQKAHPDAYVEQPLMPFLVKVVHERFKTKIRPELGETDPVRQFFLKDVNSLHILVPWTWQVLRTFYLNIETKERPSVMQRLSESNDIVLTALETAFKFRQDSIEHYDLDADSLKDGILKPGQGYDVLPEFWTSTHNFVASIRSLVDVGRNLAYESFEKGMQEDLAMKIAKDNPRLVKMGCQTHIERFQWALDQSDERMRETGKSLKEEWNTKVRSEHIYSLVDIGLATEGMNLAEYYHDMPTLVRLIWDETIYMEESKASAQSKMEQAECVVKLNRIKDRVHRYFEKYGDAWAEAFYSRYIAEHRSGQIFLKEYLNQPALTRFLRGDRTRARLTWINEVCGEKNFESSHDALFEAGARQEVNAWCKKVQLSIARLSLLSKKELKPGVVEEPQLKPREEEKLARVVRHLEYVRIQDQLYDCLAPIISGALDHGAAVQLLMAEYGQGRLVKRPALQELLQTGFDALVRNRTLEPAMLIDVLTLINFNETVPRTAGIQGSQFAYALKVLVLSWNDLNKAARSSSLKLIWKRVCIQDNWAEINNTKDISDMELREFLVGTAAGWTFKALLQMIADDPLSREAWPKQLKELLGAGCTHGELCVRFGSEDLRVPIMKDNVLDDEILQANIERHRLVDWFVAASHAAKKVWQAEQNQGQYEGAVVESDDSASVEAIEGDEAGQETATAGAEAEASQDVEMRDD